MHTLDPQNMCEGRLLPRRTLWCVYSVDLESYADDLTLESDQICDGEPFLIGTKESVSRTLLYS